MANITGWTGKLLRVNLSTGDIKIEDSMKYNKDLIGGAGLGYKVIFELYDGDIKISQIEKKFIVK